MLRWTSGITLLDKVRNEETRKTFKVRPIGEKVRGERLRLFGHVYRRPEEYAGKRAAAIEVPGKAPRGRPAKRWVDCVKDDLKKFQTAQELATGRGERKVLTRMAGPT